MDGGVGTVTGDYVFEQINIREDLIEEISDDTNIWINQLIKRINDKYPNIDTIDYIDYCKIYQNRQFDIEDNKESEIKREKENARPRTLVLLSVRACSAKETQRSVPRTATSCASWSSSSWELWALAKLFPVPGETSRSRGGPLPS